MTRSTPLRTAFSPALFSLAALCLTALCLTAPPAQGQSVGTLLLSPVPANTESFSLADCLADSPPTIGVTWEGQIDDEVLPFVSTGATCDPESSNVLSGYTRLKHTLANTLFNAEGVSATGLFGAIAAEGEEACREDVEQELIYCVEINRPSIGGLTTVFRGKVDIRLDSKPPSAPTGITVSPRESGLQVGWSVPSEEADEITLFIVEVRHTGTGAVTAKEFTGAERSGRIEGLENDVEYEVVVYAVDDAGSSIGSGNRSASSEAQTGTPQEVHDFWENYHQLGGQETGGCASAAPWALALLPLLLLKRRRPRGIALLPLLTLTGAGLWSAPAQAQYSPVYDDQSLSVELRTGPYRPNVDEEPGLSGKPWSDTFGADNTLLWRLEVDYDLFRAFGRLGVGASLGFARFKGKALLPSGEPSEDTVTFSLIPITPVVYYRADFIHRLWRVPLVPYAKAGFGFVRWATNVEGNRSESQVGGQKRSGDGWAKGLELSAGLQLVLDLFEPDQAAEMEQDFGINSTSLYFDATWLQWKSQHLLLEDVVFSGGLLLAF